MKIYKHYSFDLWLTLIKSNPQYKKQRTKYFFEHFNQKKKTFDEVDAAIREVEKMVDYVNQTTGFSMPCVEIVAMILYKLEYHNDDLGITDMIAIVHMMQQQFLDCPPVLYDNDTSGVLHYLHSEGCTISILSNTAFIVGSTLEELLKRLGISKYISFSIFSDQIGMSKPSPQVFELLILKCQAMQIDKKQIIHIGDNTIADIKGAKSVGIASLQINSNQHSIKDIFK